jgi:hypothetical protein
MFNKNETEQILKGIVWLNEQLGIWSWILPIIFAVTVLGLLYRSYQSPSRSNTRLVLGAYTLIYIYSGWTIFIGHDFLGWNMALAGAIGLWFVAVFLMLDIVFCWTDIRLPEKGHLRILSWSLIAAGIFFYPVLEVWLGFTFPRMVFFGAECPTTISLIGLFIGTVPRVNKPLFIIISLNAIATGSSVALAGATFDYLYALAGIIGLAILGIHFKAIFKKPGDIHGR